jgi:hypothetical protein
LLNNSSEMAYLCGHRKIRVAYISQKIDLFNNAEEKDQLWAAI